MNDRKPVNALPGFDHAGLSFLPAVMVTGIMSPKHDPSQRGASARGDQSGFVGSDGE